MSKKARKRKRRVFLSGSQQQLHDARINMDGSAISNADLVATGEDRTFTIFELKHLSDEHMLPREMPFCSVSDDVAEPDDESHLIMPDHAQKLLPFILPKKLRASVAGDLAEDFRTYAVQWGRPYALRWLRWELAVLCISRFGPTAIITGVGIWLRRKLGL